MEHDMIRLLRADEIECRVSIINERGLSLLLFKDARVDQKILDETFSPFGWKRSHQVIDGNLYCTVEVWDNSKKQWIAKQDVGAVSNSSKEKGQASDSFKRACFNWGVGRELYTAPFIWISSVNANIRKKDDRYITSDNFSVCSIAYNERREIEELMIVNDKGKTVFVMKRSEKSEAKNMSGYLSAEQIADLTGELERTGISMNTVLKRYHIEKAEQMTPEIYTKALNGLKKTKSKEAA